MLNFPRNSTHFIKNRTLLLFSLNLLASKRFIFTSVPLEVSFIVSIKSWHLSTGYLYRLFSWSSNLELAETQYFKTVEAKFIFLRLAKRRHGQSKNSFLEETCVRKETVDVHIRVTPRNGDWKIMQPIKRTSRFPSRKTKRNQLSQFWRISTKVIPIEKT